MKLGSISTLLAMVFILSMAILQEGFAEDASIKVEQANKGYAVADDKRAYLLGLVESQDERTLRWVAVELGAYPDDDVVVVLEELRAHKQRNKDLRSVARAAQDSLERIAAAEQVALLQTSESLKKKEPTLREMALGDNEYARRFALDYLLGVERSKDGAAVRLLAELYPYERQAKICIARSPSKAKKGIRKALTSKRTYVVEASIELAGDFGMSETLPHLVGFLRTKREGLDNIKLRLAARVAMHKMGDVAVPFLDELLRDETNVVVRLDAVDTLQEVGTEAAISALRNARESEKRSENTQADVITRLNKAIDKIERGRK